MKDRPRQIGTPIGWFMCLARCPKCDRDMWSNGRRLYCPVCNIKMRIK